MESKANQILQQAVIVHQQGKLEEAERLYRAILQSQPKHPDANHNLGVLAVYLNKTEAALPFFKTAVDANPKIEQFWLSYIDVLIKDNQINNAKRVIKKAKKKGFSSVKLDALAAKFYPKTQVGNADTSSPSQYQLNSLLKYYQTGQSDDAEKLAKSITQQFPQHQFAWKVLGAIFGQSGRTVEAENANQTSVALSPEDAAAHYNLGNTLKDLGRLEEAEASYRRAIALKPDFSEAYFILSVILAINEDYDSALDIIAKGNDIEPNIQKFTLMLDILKSRQIHENNRVRINGIADSVLNMRLASNPLISHRKVEPELVANLYDISTRGLDETSDERFGNGRTTDWFLFENSRFIMECVKEDLINIIKKIVKSDVHVCDSFFNILGAGSGSDPHQHLNKLDRTEGLNLYKQKYVLQYYLRVGDQDCSEPGLYKLYEPDEEILPSEGMIIVIPAERMHAAVYGGDKDRVMIGINFYAL